MLNKTIYTSYFGNYRQIPIEYQCVSIANSKPSIGVPTWMDVVPEWGDVEAVKQRNFTATEFAYRYYKKLNRLSAAQVFEYLNKFEADTIVLLCWESHHFECHRTLLTQWLKHNLNINVEEHKSEYYTPMSDQIYLEILRNHKERLNAL